MQTIQRRYIGMFAIHLIWRRYIGLLPYTDTLYIYVYTQPRVRPRSCDPWVSNYSESPRAPREFYSLAGLYYRCKIASAVSSWQADTPLPFCRIVVQYIHYRYALIVGVDAIYAHIAVYRAYLVASISGRCVM